MHYLDRSGKSYELITIDDPPRSSDTRAGASESVGPAARRLSSDGKFAVLSDSNGVAEVGVNATFTKPLGGGGMLTRIEIVTPYSLVKRVQEQPISPFQ